MTKWSTKTRRSEMGGFSLIEALVVVAILLILAVVAVPNILQGMRMLRLRSNATNIATLLQQARMRAVRDNRSYQVLATNVAVGMNNNWILFVDGTMGPGSFGDGYTRGEPYTVLARDVIISNVAPAGAPNIFIQNAMAPGAGVNLALQVSDSTVATAPTFNPRGVPCRVAGGGLSSPTAACNTTNVGGAGVPQPVAYVVYLQSTTVPNDGWSAVTVSPGGRIRSWIYAAQANARWR